MRSFFAKILGRHTARVLSRLTGCVPDSAQVDERIPGPEGWPVCELAARIDFEGRLAGGGEAGLVGGYLVLGALKEAEFRPLLEAVVRQLGLGADILDAPSGPQNLLNEFLNIVIGLTVADWAEHGFDMEFSPPHTLSGRPWPLPGPEDQAFHIRVSASGGPKVEIVVVFGGQKVRR